MKGRLTEKEKEELRKILEEEDKPADESWLMVDYYAKLSKKNNPHKFICKLCSITHLSNECPNKKIINEKKTYTYSYYDHDLGDGD